MDIFIKLIYLLLWVLLTTVWYNFLPSHAVTDGFINVSRLVMAVALGYCTTLIVGMVHLFLKEL